MDKVDSLERTMLPNEGWDKFKQSFGFSIAEWYVSKGIYEWARNIQNKFFWINWCFFKVVCLIFSDILKNTLAFINKNTANLFTILEIKLYRKKMIKVISEKVTNKKAFLSFSFQSSYLNTLESVEIWKYSTGTSFQICQTPWIFYLVFFYTNL